jgi:hypothetical protein
MRKKCNGNWIHEVEQVDEASLLLEEKSLTTRSEF